MKKLFSAPFVLTHKFAAIFGLPLPLAVLAIAITRGVDAQMAMYMVAPALVGYGLLVVGLPHVQRWARQSVVSRRIVLSGGLAYGIYAIVAAEGSLVMTIAGAALVLIFALSLYLDFAGIDSALGRRLRRAKLIPENDQRGGANSD